MQQHRPLFQLLTLAAFCTALCSCGTANDAAPSLNAVGQHPSNWLSSHGAGYATYPDQCRQCHGQELTGGITGIGCSDCHLGPHPVPFPSHRLNTNQTNDCAPCHGATLQGSGNAPSCTSCHILLPAGTVPVLNQCNSCHGNPPNGAVYPNISGLHAKHTNLAYVATTCTICHYGGGSGTATHGSQLTVAFRSTYNENGVIASRATNGTCSGVSCHGGVTTPAWSTGRINVSTDCSICHADGTALPAATKPYNSFYSGQHTLHAITYAIPCRDCHDMTITSGGNSHFSNLSTHSLELAPALTIRPEVVYTGGTCNPGITPLPNTFVFGHCHDTKPW